MASEPCGLDLHCLPEGKRLCLANNFEGHERIAQRALVLGALVCFKATGDQEWKPWAALDAAGVETRHVPPAQIKAFAASGDTRAKTDRTDAELIARLMAFWPDGGPRLPHEKIRFIMALVFKRGQIVEA